MASCRCREGEHPYPPACLPVFASSSFVTAWKCPHPTAIVLNSSSDEEPICFSS